MTFDRQGSRELKKAMLTFPLTKPPGNKLVRSSIDVNTGAHFLGLGDRS